eukprot:TsM_000139500 transcript=TsM_000139500 gene=TsM_000139500
MGLHLPFGGFGLWKQVGEERFMDPAVAQLYNSLVNASVNDPYEDALRFLEFVRGSKNSDDCLMKLRLDAHTLVSTGATPQLMERHMKFLLLVQFEYTKAISSRDPDSVDYKFSDWVSKAAQILERLSLCSFNRSDWKDFIKNDLVDRFASTHGKTLAQIYMAIGLEPPSCLPNVDEADDDDGDYDKVVDDPSSLPMLNLEDQLPSVQCPKAPSKEVPSHRIAKISARNSLPRALFIDSVIFPSSEGAPWSPTSQTSPESSSIASTSYSQPIGHVGRKYATRSKPGTPASHLVLMPASRYTASKSRRKARTPVKWGFGQLSRSPMVGTDCKSRRRRIPSGSHGGSGRRKSLHRSVAETPNSKMSQPRWERARMAAAKKTKGRVFSVLLAPNECTRIQLVMVAESPLKPSEPGSVISSPLRRLRRASSLLNFRRGDLSSCDSGGGVSSTASTSRLSVKAELWQRRQMEEEASLSQFSGGESNLSQSVASSAASVSSPQFQRRTSNLMANLVSLRSLQSSTKNAKKPVLSSVVSSPPILNLSKLEAEFSRPRSPPVPSKGLSHHLGAPSSTTTNTPSTSVKTPAKPPPTTSATLKRRKTGPRGQMATVGVPTSPNVFDEATMFPGEGEFFQRTATDLESSSFQRKILPLGGGNPHTTRRKCVPRLPSTGGGDDENLRSTMVKVEVTPLRIRNPLTPAGNTRSLLRSEAPGWSPNVPPTSATKRRGIPSSHQVTTRKGLFHPTASPLLVWNPDEPSTSGVRGRGSLPFDQVTTRATTPRKGLFRPTVTTPQPRAQDNVGRQMEEATDSPRMRLRARRSLF